MFFISSNDSAAYASSYGTEAFVIKSMAVGEGTGQHNMRPTSETERYMEEKQESVEEKRDNMLFTVLAWIFIVLLFAAGVLFIFFPDIATELNFFWHNLLNVWTKWDTTTWDFRFHRVESSGTPRIFDYIIAAVFIICSLIGAEIILLG